MIQTEPIVNPNGKYELRHASEVLQVSKSTILRWTSQGLMRCSVRRTNGRKVWTGADIIRAWRSIM